MPRFDFDPNSVSATFAMAQKGRHEFLIGKPKAFQSLDKETGVVKNYGVRASLVGKDGKTYSPLNLYMHSDGAQKFTKQIVMAALGFPSKPEAEIDFNSQYSMKDWSFTTPSGDGEEGSVGEVWQLLEGKRIDIECDITINNDTKAEQQQYKGFFPLGV